MKLLQRTGCRSQHTRTCLQQSVSGFQQAESHIQQTGSGFLQTESGLQQAGSRLQQTCYLHKKESGLQQFRNSLAASSKLIPANRKWLAADMKFFSANKFLQPHEFVSSEQEVGNSGF